MRALFKNKLLGRLLLFCFVLSLILMGVTALTLYHLFMIDLFDDVGVIYYGLGAAFVVALVGTLSCMIFIKKQVSDPMEALLANTRRYASQLKEEADPSKADFAEIFLSSRDEFSLFSDTLSAMAAGIKKDTSSYSSLAEACRRYEKEAEMSERIIRNTLPSVYPAFPERTDFDVFASLGQKGSGGFGFYDYFMPDENHICMTVGEASGRGMPSMLYAHMALSGIRSFARLGYAPHRIATMTNNLLSLNNSEGITVSAVIALVDLTNGVLSYVNAGEPDLLIKRAGESFVFTKQRQSFVLAGMENVTFTQNQLTLMQGDTLLFMNSAVPETANDRGVAYGEASVKDCLNNSIGGKIALPELVMDIEGSLDYFRKGTEQDMMALLMFRYFG